MKGWQGLAWLSGFNWSSLPISILIVLLCSLAGGRARWRDRMKFLGAGSVFAVAAFLLERWTAFELFSGGAPAGLNARTLGTFILEAAIVPAALPWLSNRWLEPVYWRTVVYLAVALVLVFPLSFATIQIVPALNGSTDQIHAIKMGYPVFWTALLVPAGLRLGRRAVAKASVPRAL